MRWLFLFVLIVNISYVAWEYSRPDEAVRVTKNVKNVPTILLLSELQPAAEPDETDRASEQHQPVVVDEAISEPEQADSGLPVTAPAVAVSETSVETCFTLGPFRELEKLRVFTRAVKDYVSDASFRSREEQEQSMFWVYLPPEAGFSEARALGAKLEKLKIRDYYIINKDEQKYGVSLGHFREKDRAYRYAGRIRKLGFRPVVEPVFRTYTIYWLDYTVLPGKVIPESVFEQQLDSNVNRLHRPCA